MLLCSLLLFPLNNEKKKHVKIFFKKKIEKHSGNK